MENSYVNAVIGNTSDFCNIFINYEDELLNLGEKCDAISKEVEDYNSKVAVNGNPSEQSYDALDDSRKYRDESGNVIAYGNLTEIQKRGLAKQVGFIADREIELQDKLAEATYEMNQSARSFVKDLKDKMGEVRRSNNHLSQLNLQYVADMARNQNVIDDCIHDMTKASTVEEKRELTNRRIQTLKENRKTELTFRINMALINATNLIETVFNQVVNNIEAAIANDFENVDTYSAGIIEDKMDIMSDLTKLMASFTNIKNEYQKEKELITSINEKCKAMKRANDDKDVKKFANNVMKTTKEFSKLIEDIQKYNEDQKLANDEPKPEEQTPEEKTPDEPKPEEQTPDEPTTDEPTVDKPEEPKVDKPEEPKVDKPEEPKADQPEEPKTDQPEEPAERQNQEVEYKVNRRRQSDSAKRNLAMAALGVGLVAANGLGLAPVTGAVLSGGIIAVAGAGVAKGLLTVGKRRSATHKLRKIAKQMQKEGLNIRLGDFDYEKGTVGFIYTTDDGQDIPLMDADQDPKLIGALQDRLDKSFKNDKRGLHEAASKSSKFEIDMQEMPKVTVNNLEAAFAPIGGIRSFKDDVFGEAFSWDTHSSLIAKIKDSKFMRNLKDKEEKPVTDAEIDDILEEEEEEKVTATEEEVEVTAKEEPEVTATDEAKVTATDEAEVTATEEAEVTATEEAKVTATEEKVDAAAVEDLFKELDDPSKEDMFLTDEEIAALLGGIEHADNIEQELTSAAEEHTRGL